MAKCIIKGRLECSDSLKVVSDVTVWYSTYGFLIMLHSNCVPILCRLRDLASYWSKIANIHYHHLRMTLSLEWPYWIRQIPCGVHGVMMFSTIWILYCLVTGLQTDRQSDRQTPDNGRPICCVNIASRGKKTDGSKIDTHWTVTYITYQTMAIQFTQWHAIWLIVSFDTQHYLFIEAMSTKLNNRGTKGACWKSRDLFLKYEMSSTEFKNISI